MLTIPHAADGGSSNVEVRGNRLNRVPLLNHLAYDGHIVFCKPGERVLCAHRATPDALASLDNHVVCGLRTSQAARHKCRQLAHRAKDLQVQVCVRRLTLYQAMTWSVLMDWAETSRMSGFVR